MAGRNPKYSTEMLQLILDEFFSKKAVFGQVTATEIAKFAVNELGYKDIKYFHFTRNKEIKALLTKTNDLFQKSGVNNLDIVIQFNPEKFIETYENNKKMQITVLRYFADRYNGLNQSLIDLNHLKNQYEIELKMLKDENSRLKTKNKTLKNEILKIKDINKKLNKFKIFNDEIKMREYLKENNLFNGFDEENLMIILEKCGFKTSEITEEDIVDIIENTSETDIENQQDEEQEEINRLMTEIDDLL